MPHRGLCGSRSGAVRREHRSERRSQGVNIDGTAAVVALGDARGFHVTVKDATQPGRHREQQSGRGQIPFANPLAEFRGKIGTEGNRRAGAVLLVLRFEVNQKLSSKRFNVSTRTTTA